MSDSEVLPIIIGRESNLSSALVRKGNFISLSSREILFSRELLNDYKKHRVKLIFNNFQPSVELGNIDLYEAYVQRAILSTTIVLDYFLPAQIEKIIYTSSSSVYGNSDFCQENDVLKPMNLHASLKIANEKIIESYAKKNDINYTIARIFNMYGGEDKFSIISKIISAYENNKVLTIVNNGSSIRDFIHIDNVVEAYIKLLNSDNIPIINIGRGEGTSVGKIIEFLREFGVDIQTINIERAEIELSTSDNSILREKLGVSKFYSMESYLKKRLNL